MDKKKIKEAAKALMSSKSQVEAYIKVHPESSKENAKRNASRFFNNEAIVNEINGMLDGVEEMAVNKGNLVKLLGMVIKGKMQGKERTSDFLKAIELMSKLVPEFIDRKAINDYEQMKDTDLDNLIKQKLDELEKGSSD